MTAENPLMPKNTSNGMQTMMKIQLIWLSFHVRFLNFSENIGISATNKYDISMTKQKRQIALNESEMRKLYPPTTNDPQNNALAGVGRPINEVV